AAYAAGPDTVDQHPAALVRAGRIIGASDGKTCHRISSSLGKFGRGTSGSPGVDMISQSHENEAEGTERGLSAPSCGWRRNSPPRIFGHERTTWPSTRRKSRRCSPATGAIFVRAGGGRWRR